MYTRAQKISLTLLRLSLGILFLYSGLDKLLSDFSASGFLQNATKGPFAELFASMAGNVVVDWIVIFGEILIGLSLISGLLVRVSSFFGALMMALFYLAVLPPEHGIVNQNIVYICALGVLIAFDAGRAWGLDRYLKEWTSQNEL